MTAPATSRNLHVSSLRLAAVLTAVSLSRAFVRQTLTHWQHSLQIETAVLVTSELVTNAVKRTGGTDPEPQPRDSRAQHVIGIQLRLVDASLYVEVWDRGDGAPVIPEQSLSAEGGRGLFLVESLSKRWDTFRPRAGGKVVWAELALTETANPSFIDTEVAQADTALMQRVLDGCLLPRRYETEYETEEVAV